MKELNRNSKSRDSHQLATTETVQRKRNSGLPGNAKDSLIQRSILDQAKDKSAIQMKGVGMNNSIGLEQEADTAGQAAALGERAVVNGHGSGIQKKDLKELPLESRKKVQVSMDNNNFESSGGMKAMGERDYFDDNFEYSASDQVKNLVTKAEFNGVDPYLQPGLKRMLQQYLTAGFLQPNTSTTRIVRYTETKLAGNLTLEPSLREKGNQNIAYRFTYYSVSSTVNGKTVKTPKILIEELGEVKENKLSAESKANFKKKFDEYFKLVGFADEKEIETLYEVTSKLPVATLEKIKGLTFKRAEKGEDSEDAGEYDIGNNVIIIYDLAFKNKDYLLGNAANGFNDFAKMTMFHEIGHAVDGAPVRKLYNNKRASAKAYLDLDKRINAGDKTVKQGDLDTAAVKMNQSIAAFDSKHRLSGGSLYNKKALTKDNTAFRIALKADGGKTITKYGEDGYAENFAECYALFYTDPERLELLRPNVYAYFKNGNL